MGSSQGNDEMPLIALDKKKVIIGTAVVDKNFHKIMMFIWIQPGTSADWLWHSLDEQ
jgi:hypothetical protein